MDTEDLKNSTKQIDLFAKSRRHIVSSAHGTFFMIDQMEAINQVSVDLQGLKPYKVCSLTIVEFSK